jgi:DNA (cytosine-5)-methyltransferase 1
MPFKYNKLWKLLVDKGLNKSELCEKTGISRSTLNKLNGGENVNIEILEKICACLDCGIEDIVEYTKEKEVHQ